MRCFTTLPSKFVQKDFVVLKNASIVLFLSVVCSTALADGYSGFGIGYSEACRTLAKPEFAGGDCIKANVDVHGFVGHKLSEYFMVEGSLDLSFDGGHVVDAALETLLSDDEGNSFYTGDDSYETNRWSVTTLAVAAFGRLPLGDSAALFAGPTFGGSIVNFDYDVEYFGNGDAYQGSATDTGFNYGWAAGLDLGSTSGGGLRLQWQNWRSLDTNVAENRTFNLNTFTLSFIANY